MLVRQMTYETFKKYAMMDILNPGNEDEVLSLIEQLNSDRIIEGWEQETINKLRELGEAQVLNDWFLACFNQVLEITPDAGQQIAL